MEWLTLDGYWEQLKESQSPFSPVRDDEDIASALGSILDTGKQFMLDLMGVRFDTEIGQAETFHLSVAPANSAWRTEVNGRLLYNNIGRIGMSKYRADGTSYLEDGPAGPSRRYKARPNYNEPAALVYYHSLPIWGGVYPGRAEYAPERVTSAGNRFLLFECASRRREEDKRRIIVDTRIRSAIYYDWTFRGETIWSIYVTSANISSLSNREKKIKYVLE